MRKTPGILHQMAPADSRRWHPIWRRCQASWRQEFAGFDYQMWDDERIDAFVRERFPGHYPVFAACPLQIIKIDFARYMILYEYGGIYADMDMYCYRNFYDELDRDVHLVEVFNEKNDELVQNSLMTGVAGHPFFRACIEESAMRLRLTDPALLTAPDPHAPDLPMSSFFVRAVAGPILLSHVYSQYHSRSDIGLLSRENYNAHHLTYRESYRTKHMVTGRWGEIVRSVLIDRKTARGLAMSDEEYEKLDYREFRSVSADDFDFRKNYLD